MGLIAQRQLHRNLNWVPAIALAMVAAWLVGTAYAETVSQGKSAGGSSSSPAELVVISEVEARQAIHVPPPDRVRRASDSDLVSQMEFFDRDEIINARQRILDFEQLAQEALRNGTEPPQFWQPYDPAVDHMDWEGGPAADTDDTLLDGQAAQDPSGAPWARMVFGPDGPMETIPPAEAMTIPSGPDAPSVNVNWQGPADTGRPSDSTVAASLAHVGVMVNKQLAFYRKDGTTVVGPIDYEVWWSGSPVPNDLYDPKIVYDPHEGRWIMIALNGRGGDAETYYAISVSQTSNPEGLWWTWYLRSDIDGSTDTAFWADHTRVGFDSGDATSSSTTGGGVYLVTNQYNASDSFQYTKLRVLKKHQLYTGASVSWWDFWDWKNPDDSRVFMWSPAVTTSVRENPIEEFMINTHAGGGSEIYKWRITNPLASGPTLVLDATISTNSYSVPPAAKQSGGGTTLLIDTWDCRTQDVQYRGGFLYLAIGDAIDWGTPTNVEAVLHYWKIGGNTNTVYWDERYGNDDQYYFFPTIGANADLDATIGFSRSSASMFPEMRVSGREVGDTATQGSSLIKAGEATYNPSGSTVERWGDWSGLGMDCAGDQSAAFVANQYSLSSTNWSTWVGGSSYDQPVVTHLDDAESLFTNTERYFTMEIESYDWGGAALYNATGTNHNLAGSMDCPFGTPYQNSTYGVDVHDFIVADGRNMAGYHQMRATNVSGGVGYRVEARNQAQDAGIGSSYSRSFVASEIMHVYESALTSGKTYAATVDITSGSSDLDLWMFKGSRSHGRRADNDGFSTSSTSGASGDETIAFTASESSTYGFVVTNENFGASAYTFKMWQAPVIASIGSQYQTEGLHYVGPNPGLSEGTFPVTYSIVSGPAGMTINPFTGVVQWLIPTYGTHWITIRATNPAGTDTEQWPLFVADSLFADGFQTGNTERWSQTSY